MNNTNDFIRRGDAIEAVHDRICQIGYERNANVLSIRQAVRDVTAADVVEVVYCHDCVHRPEAAPGVMSGVGVEAPRDEEGWRDDTCPYLCGDPWYNIMPHDEWFCHHGERKKDDDAQGSL